MATTESRLRKLVAHHLDIDSDVVEPDASFLSLGADSLDMVELMMATEDEFGVEISDADAEAAIEADGANFGALLALVRGKLGEGGDHG